MQKNKRKLIVYSAFILVIVAIAILAPLITPFDPNEAILTNANQSPNSTHLFGTDKMGRDVFSRVIYGARTSLASTTILVFLVFTIGGVLGMIAGYFGGKVDIIIMRISDMMVSFPGMALAIAMAGVLGPSIINAVIAITMVTWTKYARLSRSLVLKIRHMDYITASQLSGSSSFRIICNHLIPAILPTLIITATTDMGGMMLELAGFSFLGLGAKSTSIEWGYMLNEGRQAMQSAPWLMIFPGLAIFITVVIFNLLGDSIRDILDPNSKNSKNTNKKWTLKNILQVGLVFIIIGGLISFGLKMVSDTKSKSHDHLDFGCYKYSNSIDPVVNVNSSWCGVRYGITECLFKFDNNVIAQPNLCDKIEHSDDYKTWTIHMSDDVFFSNGNPVTASAVVQSIERLYKEINAELGGTGNSNPTSYLQYESIKADDTNKTVTIVCEKPTFNMEGILAYPYFAIVDVSVIDEQVIGTGPYKVDVDNVDISMEMSKNPYYRTEVPYETVTIMYVDDNSTKSMALQSGNIDLVENITSADALLQISSNDDYYISKAPGVRTGNSYMNYKSKLKNDTLRKAVLMALDSKTMCDVTVDGMYTEGFSVLPSSLAYNYDKLVNPYSFDREKAIKMLDEAGIVDTNGDGYRELDGENIDLNYIAYSSRNLNDFAQAIALQLEEIGIKTTVNVRDYDTALALQNAGEFDLITSNSITVGIGDPQDFLGNWYTPNAVNYGYYSNAEFDSLYEELMGEFDTDKRLDIITRLQQILIDDACNIVHGYYNSTLFSRTDKISQAEIATIDYYWLTTDILPLD